jgi:hypothetical protein
MASKLTSPVRRVGGGACSQQVVSSIFHHEIIGSFIFSIIKLNGIGKFLEVPRRGSIVALPARDFRVPIIAHVSDV